MVVSDEDTSADINGNVLDEDNEVKVIKRRKKRLKAVVDDDDQEDKKEIIFSKEQRKKDRLIAKELQRQEDADAELKRCLDLKEEMTEALVNAFGNEHDQSSLDSLRSQVADGRCKINEAFSLPPSLQGAGESFESLKRYQQAGVQWLYTLHLRNRNGILADEMGLGKTAQTLVFLQWLYSEANDDDLASGPTVILVPAGLLDNWMKEIAHWAPQLTALKYHGSQKERTLLGYEYDDNPDAYEIIVTTASIISGSHDRHWFKKKHFTYAIVDEAHGLKNADSMRSKSFSQKINADRRILLTGTPIQNDTQELVNLLVMVMPAHFSIESLELALYGFMRHSAASLREREAANEPSVTTNSPSAKPQLDTPKRKSSTSRFSRGTPGSTKRKRRTKELAPDIIFLQMIMAPFILRRLKEEVTRDLPPKVEIVERCPMQGVQLAKYNEELSQARSLLADNLRGMQQQKGSATSSLEEDPESIGSTAASKQQEDTLDNEAQTVSNILNRIKGAATEHRPSRYKFVGSLLFRLRRVCNHPVLVQGLYRADQYKRIAKYLQAYDEGYRNNRLERVEEFIASFSDFEIHSLAVSHSPALDEFLIPSEYLLESAKIVRLMSLLEEIAVQKEKALVFSQFTTFLDVIEEVFHLHRPDLRAVRIDGSTPVKDRTELMDNFSSDPDIQCMLLSTKAGGHGLNLIAANHVILMDQDWNPFNDRQAEDRAHRLGQHRTVSVHRLLCRQSLEETILRCCHRKLNLDEAFGGNTDMLQAAILKDCCEIQTTDRESVDTIGTLVPRKSLHDLLGDDKDDLPERSLTAGLSIVADKAEH